VTAPVAKKAVQKKVAASQATKRAAASTARTGEKAIANRGKTSDPNKSPKTSGPGGSPKKKVSSTPAQSAKRPAAQRAASSTKTVVERRVETAKQSHRQTASMVKAKQRKEKVLGIAEMRPRTRMLAAEYMGAIIMAIIMLFLHNDDKTYHQRMSRFFIQITGITGIFFVLSLASTSEKVARYAIPFGLLIDTSMLIYLFKQGGAKVINAATGNASTDYAEILHNEETAHPGKPTLIAPGLVITPGNVSVTGGTLGGSVDPGLITTPGNAGVTGTPS